MIEKYFRFVEFAILLCAGVGQAVGCSRTVPNIKVEPVELESHASLTRNCLFEVTRGVRRSSMTWGPMGYDYSTEPIRALDANGEPASITLGPHDMLVISCPGHEGARIRVLQHTVYVLRDSKAPPNDSLGSIMLRRLWFDTRDAEALPLPDRGPLILPLAKTEGYTNHFRVARESCGADVYRLTERAPKLTVRS